MDPDKGNGRLSAHKELLYLKSFRMDVVRAKDLQTKGSISAIYHRSNNLVKVLLGPGRSLGYALYAVTVLDAASKLALAQTASILILSTLEQNAATGTPKEMASGLLLLATSLVIVQLLKYFVAGHSGSWFMRRAKYAVTKKDDITPGKKAELTTMEVSTLMQDLYSVKTIFLDHKFELISNIIVEFSGILAIGLFSARLMYVALALYGCGKALSLIDDLMIIHEQHRMADIVRRNASSSNAAAPAEGETEKDLRFFHNVTGGRHMVVKTVGNIYSYCSPVVFLYAAMNFGSLQAQKTDGAITKQELLQSSIYFFLVAITQLKGHGRMTKFLSQMGHCERVLEVSETGANSSDFWGPHLPRTLSQTPTNPLPPPPSHHSSMTTTTSSLTSSKRTSPPRSPSPRPRTATAGLGRTPRRPPSSLPGSSLPPSGPSPSPLPRTSTLPASQLRSCAPTSPTSGAT
jgi:hypothetical protein